MELLIDSKDPRRSNNGGEYAKGYSIGIESGTTTVFIDRCFGSDFEGEYIHKYQLPGISIEKAKALVLENREVFASMCNGKAVEALLNKSN